MSLVYQLWFAGQITQSGAGLIVRQDFDRAAGRISTNWFVIPQLNLGLGTNLLIVTATDLETTLPASSCSIRPPTILRPRWA